VALARLAVCNTRLWLLDEVLSSLDLRRSRWFYLLLKITWAMVAWLCLNAPGNKFI